MKHIPMLNLDEIEMIPGIMEVLSPTTFPKVEDRERPYDGQPHTDTGARGRTMVRGITFRDLRDCFMRACFLASGLGEDEWPRSVYDLPWDHMDIIAVQQNMACEVERLMGIFPNVESLRDLDGNEIV
jgi:hypothetical protein